jgi:hypothetical protein
VLTVVCYAGSGQHGAAAGADSRGLPARQPLTRGAPAWAGLLPLRLFRSQALLAPR